MFAVIGGIAILLGGLWLVQGLGLVTIKPILCVADCETLEGPAPAWAVAGGVLLLAGAGVLWWALRRR
jgi:hypothetical protein